jgi:hypothetical protein
MGHEVYLALLETAAKKCHRRPDIPDIERYALTYPTRPAGPQHTALVRIGHGENRFQYRTGTGFKCRQVQSAPLAAVQVEDRWPADHPPLDADMKACAIQRVHKMGFRQVHASACRFLIDR